MLAPVLFLMALALPEKIRLRALVEERLHAPMLALHAATEVDGLWKATEALLRAALAPSARVTLFLGHFGMGEARLALTSPPIAESAEWYTERGRLNPFSPFIAAHRGLPCYRFADVLPPRTEFRSTEFYRRFAVAEGWEDGISGLFWQGDEVNSMFSVYRAAGAPAFTEFDVQLVLYLRPYLGTAIERVRKLHQERLYRRVLEEFNRDLPVGLLILDWETKLVFANQEAYRLAAIWNHGPDGPRMFNPRDCWALPEPVRSACDGLRSGALLANPKDPSALAALRHEVNDGDGPVRARVSLLQTPAGVLAKPGFFIILEARSSPTASPVEASRLPLLAGLTPSERAVALLVAEGLSNQEVADRTGKSVLTVKTQLNRVFGKLGLKSRAQLVAWLRRGP